jgi:hypothetical protein
MTDSHANLDAWSIPIDATPVRLDGLRQNVPMILRQAWSRIYADFAMPSRLAAYRDLLEAALRARYVVTALEDFWSMVVDGELDPHRRFLILRHDIDTDPATGREMWKIERSIGIRGSYFFRLSTIDLALMDDIRASGAHASYHYEELATLAKLHRARSPEAAMRLVPEARELFRTNLERLRLATGLPMRVVASHGDFMNRRLGIPNWVLLDDAEFRDAVGIDLEAYDDALVSRLSSRHSDTLHPVYWIPLDPLEAIRQQLPVVQLLVHPRHWRVNRRANARDNVTRVGEALRTRVPRLGGRGT